MGATQQQADKQADRLQGIEYSIYTFERAAGDKGQGKWERQQTMAEMPGALALAEKLFKSGKYRKVEVKQKYFDKKTNRNIDTTLKIFQDSAKGQVNLVAVVLFAIVCGAAAFGLTYFLTR